MSNVVIVPLHLVCRLLYTNPVCLLSVVDLPQRKANVMTVSWLSPINNKGGFVMSLHKKRYTAHLLKTDGLFVLSVPVKGMEELVLSIGGISGSETNKFIQFQIVACSPGWTPLSPLAHSILCDTSTPLSLQLDHSSISEQTKQQFQVELNPKGDLVTHLAAPDSDPSIISDVQSSSSVSSPSSFPSLSQSSLPPSCSSPAPPPSRKPKPKSKKIKKPANNDLVAVSECVAHMVCKVVTKDSEADDAHTLWRCQIEQAFVLSEYWNGKNFIHPEDKPYLSFLGSKKFAYVV